MPARQACLDPISQPMAQATGNAQQEQTVAFRCTQHIAPGARSIRVHAIHHLLERRVTRRLGRLEADRLDPSLPFSAPPEVWLLARDHIAGNPPSLPSSIERSEPRAGDLATHLAERPSFDRLQHR
jgi:hypothetical protein